MCDLKLNIGGYSSDSDPQPNFFSGKSTRHGKQIKTGSQINDFAFEFTPNSKVKAFAARKKNKVHAVGDDPPKTKKASEPKQPKSVSKMIANKKPKFELYGLDKHVPTDAFTSAKPIIKKPKSKHSSKRDTIDKGTGDGPIVKTMNEKPNIISVSVTPRIAVQSPSKRDTSSIVNNIFNPERQRRIEALKQTINNTDPIAKPQSHTYFEYPERQKHRQTMQKLQKEAPLIGQRFVNPIMEKVFSGMPLQSLNFHSHAVKNLKDLFAITELTSIQQKTIPKIFEGHDVLVRAQTGSGKTLAYALPIVEKLHNIRPKLTRNSGIQALIVVPTRELAIQSYDVFTKLLKPFTWIVPGFLSGGEKRKSEKARLRKGINILVGTPGRLLDHLINTESLNFDKVKWLVLDEADRLFELGYEKDVSKIIEALNKKLNAANLNTIPEEPESVYNKITFSDDDEGFADNKCEVVSAKKLQSILLSATLTSAVEKLAGLTLKNPLFIDNAEKDSAKIKNSLANFDEAAESLVIPSTVVLNYLIVPPKLRFIALSGLLVKECNKTSKKILVFVATQDLVDFHHDTMTELLTKKILDEDDESDDDDDEEAEELPGVLKGVRFFRLHGSMSQVERSSIFKAFCATKSGILLTTDVAARGLDVPEVDLVVQYTPTQLLSDFVHRVGRTARAGRKGRSIVFLSPNEAEYIKILEDKRIRISQIKYEPFLDILLEVSDDAKNIQDAIYFLQRRYESMVAEDAIIREKAGNAFASWVRYYSAFPKELKHIFNIRVAHMGHYAKSFGLKEPPTSIVKHHNAPKKPQPSNRLSYRNKDDDKKAKKRKYNMNAPHVPKKQNAQTICLTTSEFDSGMTKKKRK